MTEREGEKVFSTYFLFLRSPALFLMSLLGREAPGGAAYCIGESAVAAVAERGAVVGGTGTGGGGAGAGSATGSGRGRGRMCFNRLFR